MPSYTEKEWTDTRISAAEGSGVAKAIKAFNAAWPAKQSDFDGPMTDVVGAIDGFQSALATAKGKCNKAKTAKIMKPDPKKLEATVKLIDTWTKELEGNRQVLTAGVLKWKKQALIHGVAVEFASTESNLEQIKDELAELKKALDRGSFAEAQRAQTKVGFNSNILAKALTLKGVAEKLGYAAQKLKVDITGVAAKDCAPAELAGWRRVLTGYQSDLEQLEGRLDQLEAQQGTPDPDSSTGNPEYKKKLKIVIGDYNDVVGEVDSVLRELTEVAKRVTKLEQVFPTLAGPQKDTGVKALEKVREVVDTNEKRMIAAVEQIRSTSGEITKKKKTFQITPDDEQKFLVPIMNKVLSKNKRLNGQVGNCRQRVDALLGE